LAYPEGRAFSLCQHKQKRAFLEIAEKIRSIEVKLNALSVNENNFSKLEEIERELNQLAKNCRLEIQRLAKTEIIEY
ncbi:MAG: hypothetical protein QXR76_07505, partial [Candidatus Bathyarchaeia archaeon]